MLIYNDNCERLILTLDTDLTIIEPTVISATLTYAYQCGEQKTKDILASLPTSISSSSNPIQVTVGDFEGMEDKLCDGIYEFDIRIVYQGGSIINEQKCYFLDCHTACDVTDKFLTEESANVRAEITSTYQALRISQYCSSCNCKERCELFNYLTKLLKNESKCGCS